ncbi:hypothetical protein ACIG87_08120 [Micromonospora sp. NPDC051925]|uniref:hypothetical protein n=1 Tax=Micromonospora sp. NPDC051925 TaxID=3364288 RepID=UPI0037C964A5
MSARRVLAVFGVLAMLVAGCDRPGTAGDQGGAAAGRSAGGGGRSAPVDPAWQELTLPAPPGPAGRLLLRDAVSCAGRWFLVGGVVDAAGDTRPAAWSSTDGSSWSPVPIAARTFYGRQHVLYAAACAPGPAGGRGEGRVAALGAKNGGVHGNPRTGTWVRDDAGALREVPAAFELFGGPRAVSASRLAAGAGGWLIAGGRVDGAAVWTSPDAGGFTLAEGLPELAGDARGRTAAYDVVALPAGWLVVGSLLPAGGTALTPLAWTSVDGRSWRRAELPTRGGRGRAERVTLLDGVPVAVGPVPDGFAVWRADDGSRWQRVGAFGAAGPGVLSVVGLTVARGVLVAVTGDGAGRSAWASSDGGASWRAVTVPLTVADGGDTAMAVAGGVDRLLLMADDGRGSRAWWGAVASAGW